MFAQPPLQIKKSELDINLFFGPPGPQWVSMGLRSKEFKSNKMNAFCVFELVIYDIYRYTYIRIYIHIETNLRKHIHG